MKQRGFTLLEVVIAISILAFMSLFTVQAIQNALKAKSKVQKEIDKTSTLRDALRVMERDINMAFNYRDVGIELYNLTQKERQATANKPKTPAPGTPGAPGTTPPTAPTPAQQTDPKKFEPKQEKLVTHFLGYNEYMDFTTLSNVRLSEDSPISSQAEVGYKIKSCRRRSTQEQSSKCLWRRISNYIHENDITKFGEETVLLENVTEFKLRYLGPGKDLEWQEQWLSKEGGDDLTKGKFPYAVEITIEMKDPNPQAKDKLLRMTSVAAIRNPNNKKEEEKKEGATADGAVPTPGSQ